MMISKSIPTESLGEGNVPRAVEKSSTNESTDKQLAMLATLIRTTKHNRTHNAYFKANHLTRAR